MKSRRLLGGLVAIVWDITLIALWRGTVWTGPKVFVCLALFMGGTMLIVYAITGRVS